MSRLDNFWQNWTTFDNIGQVLTTLNRLGQFRQFWIILDNVGQFRTILDRFEQVWTSLSNLNKFEET